MSFKDFAGGFLTSIDEGMKKRQDDARAYFNKSMELAMRYSTSGGSKYRQQVQAARESVAKLRGAGVPPEIIQSIAGRNPEELAGYYEEISKMQAQGVKMTPEIYQELFAAAQESGEDVTSFTRRIGEPLAANLKADPMSFEADPKGSIFATMMGYNAMENAQRRLERTMIGDRSAADWLRTEGEAPIEYDIGGGLNYETAGDLIRTAEEGTEGPTKPSGLMQISKFYQESVASNYDTLVAGNPTEAMARRPETIQAAKLQAIENLRSMGIKEEDIMRAIGSDYQLMIDIEGGEGTPSAAPAPTGLVVGAIVEGYEFLGGDPNDMNSWKKVEE